MTVTITMADYMKAKHGDGLMIAAALNRMKTSTKYLFHEALTCVYGRVTETVGLNKSGYPLFARRMAVETEITAQQYADLYDTSDEFMTPRAENLPYTLEISVSDWVIMDAFSGSWDNGH